MSDSQRVAGESDRAQRGFLDQYDSHGVIPVSLSAAGSNFIDFCTWWCSRSVLLSNC